MQDQSYALKALPRPNRAMSEPTEEEFGKANWRAYPEFSKISMSQPWDPKDEFDNQVCSDKCMDGVAEGRT